MLGTPWAQMREISAGVSCPWAKVLVEDYGNTISSVIKFHKAQYLLKILCCMLSLGDLTSLNINLNDLITMKLKSNLTLI